MADSTAADSVEATAVATADSLPDQRRNGETDDVDSDGCDARAFSCPMSGLDPRSRGCVLVIGHPPSSVADASETKTFPSAVDASEALFQAVQTGDEHALEATLGAGQELTSCGDELTDKRERDRFVQKYQEMHRLVGEPDGTTVLYIGAENWPFPIPLVSRKGRWYFDAQTGAREVVFRRIGGNEVTAIEVCRAAVRVSKQNEATTRNDDPISQYAEALVSGAGAKGGTTGRATPDDQPFHGYYFVVLTERPGTGEKTGALAVVAYPAEYRSSGVMTFVVGEDGVVYERDLGPETAGVARKLKARPTSGWHAVG